MNAHGVALVLVRWLGLLFLAFGVQGALGIACARAIIAWSVLLPDALREHFDYFYATAIWGTPFYLVTGIVLLAASKGLARLVSRGVEP
jgi:hypothetical protein